MKAKLPPGQNLTAKERRLVMEFIEKEMARQEIQRTRRFFKLLVLALRDPLSPKGHGMGVVQISKVIDRINHYAQAYMQDEVFWHRADKAIIDQMGFAFEREEFAK